MIKTFMDFRDELLDRKEDIRETVIESIGAECEKELYMLKGMHGEIDRILEKARRLIKYHDCGEYMLKDGCAVCGAGND